MHLLDPEEETPLTCYLCGGDSWRIIMDPIDGTIESYECLDEDCKARLFNVFPIELMREQ